jgi:hypothetical protein
MHDVRGDYSLIVFAEFCPTTTAQTPETATDDHEYYIDQVDGKEHQKQLHHSISFRSSTLAVMNHIEVVVS